MINSKLNVKVGVDLNLKANLEQAVNGQVMPLLAQAVRAVAQKTASNWQEEVYRAKLWSGEKDAYANSISWRMTGPFSAVVESDYKHDREIEHGRPPRDLKKMLNTSLKVRRTTKGKRFLVIPFRHNTPGNEAHASAMPSGIYDLVKELTASTVTGQGQRESGETTHLSPTGGMSPAGGAANYLSNTATKAPQTVSRNNYNWGGRLTSNMMRDAGINPGEHRNMRGMVRFNTTTPGGNMSSSYLTFRIMMEGSNGWIVPAQPGQKIADRVATDMQPKAEAAFQQAVYLTMKKGTP